MTTRGSGVSKYEWPPAEGLVALCRKHTLSGAARKLGVPRSTLREHLIREGYGPDDWTEPKQLAPDGLRELAELLKGDT